MRPAIVLDSEIPRTLMRRPPTGPLVPAPRRPAPIAPRALPARQEPRAYAYPLIDWEPRPRLRDVLPFILVVAWMISVTVWMDHLERNALIGVCPTPAGGLMHP